MSHNLEAVIVGGDIDTELAKSRFELPVVALPKGLSLLPLCATYLDHVGPRFEAEVAAVAEGRTARGWIAPPCEAVLLWDDPFVHFLVSELAPHRKYVLLTTDYFGGVGDQAARGFEAGRPARVDDANETTINSALRWLGVFPKHRLDEFDTVGLGRYRHSRRMFPSFEDPA